MKLLIALAVLLSLAGLGLATAPTASAAFCEVTVATPPLGVACVGDPWCGQGMCGIEVCAAKTDRTSAVCVLRDEFTSDGCAAYVVGNLGVVCLRNGGTETCLTTLPSTCLAPL